MTTLLIEDVPDALHRKLKERANIHQRSVGKEILILLERALAESEPERESLPLPFQGTFPINDAWIANAKNQGRI